MTGLDENHVAAVLSVLGPTRTLKRTNNLRPTDSRQSCHSDGDLYFADFHREWHSICRSRREAASERFTDICESFFFRVALRYTSGNGRTLSHEHTRFVSFKCD